MTNPAPELPVFPVPTALRRTALAVSALMLVSALAGAVLALLAPILSPGEHTSWPFVAFEAVVAVAAVIGVFFGIGRYSEGPGLALACVTGTVLLGSLLGWQASGRTLLGHSLKGLVAARVGAALILAGLACATVLMRNRRAQRQAALGAAFLLPPILVGLAAMTDPGRHAIDAVMGHSPVQRLLVGIVGGLALGGSLAAGGHLVIRAFEMCSGRATSSRSA